MIKNEQIIFFTGMPGSSWSRVASVLGFSPVLNLNNSDRTPEREYYVRNLSESWSNYPNHQGTYFDPGNEFGNYLHDPAKYYTAASFKEEIAQAFSEHDDRNYLIKSHMISTHIPWALNTFPGCKFIFVIKDPNRSLSWWHNAGGFDIKYPTYDYYKDKDVEFEFTKQDYCIRRFVDNSEYPLYCFTKHLLQNKLKIDIEDPQAVPHISVLREQSPTHVEEKRGLICFDTTVSFYGFDI
jgi:hypothetical protein